MMTRYELPRHTRLPERPAAAAACAPALPSHEHAAASQACEEGGRHRKTVQQRQQAEQHKLGCHTQQHYRRGDHIAVQPPVCQLICPCCACAPHGRPNRREVNKLSISTGAYGMKQTHISSALAFRVNY